MTTSPMLASSCVNHAKPLSKGKVLANQPKGLPIWLSYLKTHQKNENLVCARIEVNNSRITAIKIHNLERARELGVIAEEEMRTQVKTNMDL